MNDWSSLRYGDSVTIQVSNEHRLYAAFRTLNEYPNPVRTCTLTAEGGLANLLCAAADGSYYSAGPYPGGTIIGENDYTLAITPLPGYAFKYARWQVGGANIYTTSSGLTAVGPNTYTACLTPEITLNIETEGQGAVTSAQFKAAWNPQPYNTLNPPGPALSPYVNGNRVVMYPSPCPGWAFHHWEYENAAVEPVTYPNPPIPGVNVSFGVYMNWWAGSGIRVPDGVETFNVKAVFVGCSCGYPDGCTAFLGLSTEGEGKTVGLCRTDMAVPTYNCIAWSVGRTDKWIQGVFPPGNSPPPIGMETIDWNYGNHDGVDIKEEWDAFYATHGFSPCTSRNGAKAGLILGSGLHAYDIDGCGGNWESKCGQNIRVTHGTTWLVNFVQYGEPAYYYN